MTVHRTHARFNALMRELGWEWNADNPVPEHQMLLTLVSEVETSRDHILSLTEAVKHAAEQLTKQVVAIRSPILNSLGELQGSPAAVECTVGQFYAADRLLKAFLDLYRPHPDANKPGCAVCGEPADAHKPGSPLSVRHKFRSP